MSSDTRTGRHPDIQRHWPGDETLIKMPLSGGGQLMSSATTNMTERDTNRRRVGLSLAVVAACLYLPFSSVGCCERC